MSSLPALREGDWSPWGGIESVTPLGPDAVSVTTPSHGGIFVRGEALARIPVPLLQTRFSQGGWFEEDVDWSIPYLALALHLQEADPVSAERWRERACKTFLRWHGEHAALLGLQPETSAAGGVTT